MSPQSFLGFLFLQPSRVCARDLRSNEHTAIPQLSIRSGAHCLSPGGLCCCYATKKKRKNVSAQTSAQDHASCWVLFSIGFLTLPGPIDFSLTSYPGLWEFLLKSRGNSFCSQTLLLASMNFWKPGLGHNSPQKQTYSFLHPPAGSRGEDDNAGNSRTAPSHEASSVGPWHRKEFTFLSLSGPFRMPVPLQSIRRE
jgi:hypothetical protein